MDILAGNIYRLRRTKQMTEEEFANISDATSQDVIEWETGAQEPPTRCMVSMARHFGVDLGDLFSKRGGNFDHELLGAVNVGY